MSDDTRERRAAEAAAGLCATCRSAREVRSDRGGRFLFCDRSRTDPRFAKYPRLPVEACAGYEPRNGSPGPGGA